MTASLYPFGYVLLGFRVVRYYLQHISYRQSFHFDLCTNTGSGQKRPLTSIVLVGDLLAALIC